MSVYVNSGSGVRNMSASVSGTSLRNATATVGEQYKLDMSESFIITAIPSEKSYNTTFGFEYYSDGEALPSYLILYNALFVVPENGPTMLIAAYAALGLLLVLLICCCVCCIRKRKH